MCTYVVLEQIPQWWKRRGKTESIWDVPEGFAYTTKVEWDLLRFTNTRRAKEKHPLLVTFAIMQDMEGVRTDELMEPI